MGIDDLFTNRYGDSPYGLEDLELIGDWNFVLGVPARHPPEFKRWVIAAAKTYHRGGCSIDYTLKKYGETWRFEKQADPGSELVWDMTKAVKSHTREALERYLKVDKPGHVGLIAASAALFRLQITLRLAVLTIRHGFHFENHLLTRLALEQLAWAYAVHLQTDDSIFAIKPSACISPLKSIFPLAGRLYGILSEVAHMAPTKSKRYVRVQKGEVSVALALPEWRLYDAYHLLLVADLYIILTELLIPDLITKHLHISRQNGGSWAPCSTRPFVEILARFWQRISEQGKTGENGENEKTGHS